MSSERAQMEAADQPGRIESHSIDVIPESERHGKPSSLGALWFVSNLNLTAMSTGVVVVALGGTMFWNLVAIIIGSLTGTLFVALHSTQGPHLGLPQLIQSRAQFGYVGAALTIFFAVFVNYLAYNTIDAMLSSDATATVVHIPLSVGYFIAAAIAAIIALFGYDMIHKVNRVLVVPTTIILVMLTVGALSLDSISAATFAPGAFELPVFMTAFVIAFGFQLGWAPYVSDYSRYLPASTSTRSLFWWTYLPSAASAIWVFGVGAIAQAGTNAATPIAAYMAAGDRLFPGAGTVIVLGLLVGLLAVMAMNQYGGSLTMLSIADSIRPLRATRAKRVAAIVSMAVMVWLIAHVVGAERFNQFYGSSLIYLAYVFTPWTAINLVDYFVVRKGHYVIADLFKPSGGVYGRWGWRGNVSYLVTIAVMIPFMVTAQFVGPIAERLASVDYSLFVGLLVSGALYLIVCRVFPTPDADATPRAITGEASAPADVVAVTVPGRLTQRGLS